MTDRLLTELPGILLWAIAGWQKLRARGQFVQPDAGKDMADALAKLASPVGAFVAECCKVEPALQVEKAVLYGRWKVWCEEQGREHPGDAATFGRNLRAAEPTIGESYPRVGDVRVYHYTGIGLA